jgi:hypothetical protein
MGQCGGAGYTKPIEIGRFFLKISLVWAVFVLSVHLQWERPKSRNEGSTMAEATLRPGSKQVRWFVEPFNSRYTNVPSTLI